MFLKYELHDYIVFFCVVMRRVLTRLLLHDSTLDLGYWISNTTRCSPSANSTEAAPRAVNHHKLTNDIAYTVIPSHFQISQGSVAAQLR